MNKKQSIEFDIMVDSMTRTQNQHNFLLFLKISISNFIPKSLLKGIHQMLIIPETKLIDNSKLLVYVSMLRQLRQKIEKEVIRVKNLD